MGLYTRNTISIGMRPFGEAQSKVTSPYAQDNIIPLWRVMIPNIMFIRSSILLRKELSLESK